MGEMVIGRGMVEILPDFRKFGKELATSMRTARSQLDGTAAGLKASAGTVFGSLAKIGKGTTLLGIGVVAASAKMAGDFQAETAVLQTAAGESAKGLGVVRKGILSVSEGTGTGIKNLTDGMYTIEKAGFRGAEGLKILTAAAQGAKEENANLSDVTNAMTSVMASYHLKAVDSVRVMNALKTSAGEGKITMEEFSGALSTVLPIASANKISFEEIGGAIASLTQHGTSAREATQELAATIRQLAKPNNVAAREMARFGLSATDVSQNLGKRGLSGTIDLLTNSILSKMGPSGKILLSSFEGTKQSAQDAQIMLSKMPASIQDVAKSYLAGKINAGDWNSAVKAAPVAAAPMLRGFKTLVDRSNGFSRELKSGGPAVKTYTDALAKMTGGAIGLNTVLQLSGESTAAYHERIKKVGESFHNASKDVEGWKVTQGLFNTQLARMKQTMDVLLIQLGTKLLPILQSVIIWLGRNKTVVFALAGLIAGILTLSVVAFAAKTAASAAKVVISFAKMGASAAMMGVNLLRGLASASAAASSSTGLAGSLGGAIRRGLSPSTYQSAFDTLRLRGIMAMEKLRAGFGGVRFAASTMATSIRQSAVSAGTAAWSGITTGVSAVGGAMKTAALATRDFAKAQYESVVANTRAAVAWTITKIQTLAQAVATGIATAAQWLWNTAMDANPITLVIIAIAALVAAIVWVATQTTWFQTAWKASWGAIQAAFFFVWNFIKDHWRLIVSIIGGPIGIVVVMVIDHWHAISNAFGDVISFIRNHWVAIVSIITGPIGFVTIWVVRHWNQISDGARSMIGSLVSWFKSLPGRITGVLGKMGSLLYSRGKDVITGFLDGLTSAFSAVTRWVSGIAKWIKDHKGPISLDRTLLHPAGSALMHGLLQGLKFGFGGVSSFIYKAGSKISDVTSSIMNGVGASFGGGASGSMSANMTIGRNIMLQMGFQPSQWQSLRTLWTNESGWRTNALNASSGAYGIPQSLPASKMGSAGSDWQTNPATQIRWGLDYIKQRYGTPSFALGQWMSRSPHWYDNGGWLPPGLSLAMNGTGRPERIRTAGQEAALSGGATFNITVVNKGVIGNKQEAIDFLVSALEDVARQHRIPRGFGGS
jgi:hypothetical protein